MPRRLGVLLCTTALLVAAAPAGAVVVRSAGVANTAVAAGADGLVAVAAPDSRHRVRVTLRDASGSVRVRTLPSHAARIDAVLAAVDPRGATTVAWEALRVHASGLAYAVTLDSRGRLLSAPSRVPLGGDMHLVSLVAGPGQALLIANVPDNLQRFHSYCSLGSVAFAGDNYFGAVKSTTGRFTRPTSIGTGDSYAGSGFTGDGLAVSGDGSGDLDTWPHGSLGGCTRWRPRRLAGARQMRSAVVLDTAGDGSIVRAGQSNAGPYTPSGDEENNPPTPAPAALHAVVLRPDGSGHLVGLGRGASPAVAAIAGGRAAFAWLDQPAPNGFGGAGHRRPSQLRVAVLHGTGHLSTIQVVPGAIADPRVAFVPQVAAASDGTVAVLESAGRERLIVRHADGTLSAPRDLGSASASSGVRVLSAGRRVYLVRQTLSSTRVSRVR